MRGGMDRQPLRDWVHRFNAEGPEGLYDKQRPGTSCRLSEARQQELVVIIEAGPDLAEHGVVRFRLCDLCALVEQRFSVTYQEQGLPKLIKKLGFRRINARPQHLKSDPEIQAEYKKFQNLVETPVCSCIAAKIRHGKPDVRPSRPAGGENVTGDRAAECPIESGSPAKPGSARKAS